MEQDKYISSGDTYIEIEGVEKDVSHFKDNISNRKIMFKMSTKSLPKAPVKLTKNNLKKFLKYQY